MLKKFEQYAIPYRAKGRYPEYFRAELFFSTHQPLMMRALIAGFGTQWVVYPSAHPPTASANAAANAT